MRTLQCCKALMFLALAGLVGSKKPIVTAALLGPPPVLVAQAESSDSCTHAHRGSSPWTKQPLNLSLETQETSFESSYCSQAKRAVSSSRRRLRSILIRGRGAAGKLVPPGSLPTWPGVSLPRDDGRHKGALPQRRGRHKPIVLLSMEMVRS